jgi:hypothetical protein
VNRVHRRLTQVFPRQLFQQIGSQFHRSQNKPGIGVCASDVITSPPDWKGRAILSMRPQTGKAKTCRKNGRAESAATAGHPAG